MKKIVKAQDLKKIALETIQEVAGIVKATLGPGGNPVVLQQNGQAPDGSPLPPIITKDGVTTASAIQYRNPIKNTIAQSIIQVSKNTVNQAGDGTTTALVLAEAIYKAGYKYIEQGMNGIQLYNALKDVKDKIIYAINHCKQKVTKDEVIHIARISANGDEDIAQTVFKAIDAVGEDGYVALEDGYTRQTELQIIEGAMYRQGYRNFGPHGSLLVTDKSRDVCELNTPAVLLYGGKLESVHDLANVIQKLMGVDATTGEVKHIVPFLVIAHDFSDDVKNFIVQNKVQAKLPIAAIKSPFDGSPNARTEILEDLACLLGATVSAQGILDLSKVTEDHLGSADKIVISAEEIAFYKGAGDTKEVLQRVEDLKKLLSTKMHDYDKDNLRIRIGKLTGGLAIVRVGGDSELEMKERKDRVEDALCAAKAAIQDGMVAGGGLTLYELADALEGDDNAIKIMKEALQAPIKQIITNVGENPDIILSKMPEGMGYNAAKKQYANLIEDGIIDPAKVVKSALENAVSIAGLLLTTGGAIVNDTDSDDGKANPLAGLLG